MKFQFTKCLCLYGTYQNAERPETAWNGLQWSEMAYNEQKTTWNEPQRVRHNLQQSEITNNEQKKMRNHHQQADFETILQYGTIGSLL